MTTQEAKKLINKILKEDSIEVGIFISMLSYEYLKKTNITEKQFARSLKNSIKILNKSEAE